MPFPFRNVILTIGIIFGTNHILTDNAQAQEKTACSQRYNVAWEMPLRSSDVGKPVTDVLKRSEFSTVRNLFGDRKRVAIGRAPDGTVAIQMNIPKGENRSSAFFLDPLGDPGVDAACLSLRIFFQKGFEWPRDGGTKLGFGLWGGTRASNLSGGTRPSDQDGWSVRNVNSQYGFRLYSYHLNRPSRFGQQGGSGLAGWGSSDWRSGQWHDIDLEVVMNDTGKSNGYAQLWLNSQHRQTMTKLRFRNNEKWSIRGLFFSDIWGGNTSDRDNFSPKAQKMWYASYMLHTVSAPAGSQQSSTSSPSDISSTPTNTDTSQSGSTTTEASVPSVFSFTSGPRQFESLPNRNATFGDPASSGQPTRPSARTALRSTIFGNSASSGQPTSLSSRFSSFADRFPSFAQ